DHGGVIRERNRRQVRNFCPMRRVMAPTLRDMSNDLHHQELETQAAAFRSAVLRAGPSAAVATCPGWDVLRLVQHVGRMYALVNTALQQDETAVPRAPHQRAEFDEALAWLDQQYAELAANLSGSDPAEPVWSYFRGGTPGS